jgi:serine/threonine-protein kinase HipA
MTQRNASFDIYLNTFDTGIIHAASAVLVEDNHRLRQFAFRYTLAYLNHPKAFSLHPHFPLQIGNFQQACIGLPGILDDYLPDAWGRRVLAKIAHHKHQIRLDENSPIDLLSYLSKAHIGALQWCSANALPSFNLGNHIGSVDLTEAVSVYIDDPKSQNDPMFQHLYLANSGSGAGGARPKALFYDDEHAWLAKFNRKQDEYDNATVELSMLRLANALDLCVGNGTVIQTQSSRPTLLLERFDVTNDLQHRYHLISVNSLLKNNVSFEDKGGAFRYDDIAEIIQHHSYNVERDLEQLLRQMLFNSTINNTDDHERNFSFIIDHKGYALSPAYDMVPSLTVGEYPNASFEYSPFLPKATDLANNPRKVFGLSKGTVEAIAEQIATAPLLWPQIAQEVGVVESDCEKIIQYAMPNITFGSSFGPAM